MRFRERAAWVCLIAAFSAVIGGPGLHAVLHAIEDHALEQRVHVGPSRTRHLREQAPHEQAPHEDAHHALADADHTHGDHDGEHHEEHGQPRHRHRHSHGGGPVHGQGAPEHLQIALTEAPPPAILPVPEVVLADEPLQLADRLLAHELAPTRSSRGPPLTRV